MLIKPVGTFLLTTLLSVAARAEQPPLELAKQAMLGRDYAAAAAHYARAAAAGEPEGEVGLGFLHHSGLGVPKDPAKALAYYAKAAGKKYPKGIYYLGRAYKSGLAGKRDYPRALALFKEAAAAGYPLGKVSAGIMYRKGEGVKASSATALRWFKQALKDRQGGVHTELGQLYRLAGDDDKTIASYRAATENGELEVASPLGYMFSRGKGVAQDYAKAVYWYKLSAEGGFSNGQYNLGDAYRAGVGVPRDDKAALKWMLISEMSSGPGNDNEGLAARSIPQVSARLTAAEVEQVRKAARDEFPVYKANHDAWNAERFLLNESPHLPGR